MSDTEIEAMAVAAGMRFQGIRAIVSGVHDDCITREELSAFAELVRAAERERAAKVCEAGVSTDEDWDHSYWDQACGHCAAAIRALK